MTGTTSLSDIPSDEDRKIPAPTSDIWGVYADVPQEVGSILDPQFAELLVEVHALLRSVETWIRSRDILSTQIGYLKLAQSEPGTQSLTHDQISAPSTEVLRGEKMKEVISEYLKNIELYGGESGLSEEAIVLLKEGMGVISTLLVQHSKNIQTNLEYSDPQVSSAVDSHRHHAQSPGYYEYKLQELDTSLDSIDESIVSYIIELSKKMRAYPLLLAEKDHHSLFVETKFAEDEILSIIYALTLRIRGSRGIPMNATSW